MFDLTGKVAIVTGGGSGIGESICHVFAQNGAEVCVLDINSAAGGQTAQAIREAGGKADFYAADVTDQQAIIALFERIFEQKGQLDILVNNAGVAHIGTAENTSEADFDRIYNVNIKGVYNCLKAGAPLMKKSGGGAILNLASIASTLGLPDRFAYSMSKGAVLSMTLTTARDFIKDGIRCNCVAPARVHTPFVDNFLAKNYPGREQEMFEKLAKTQPIGRMAKPVEIAALALYLCSDEASFITGSSFPIDGGFINLNT